MKKLQTIIFFGILFTAIGISPSYGLDTGRDEPPVMFNIFSTKFADSTPFWIKIGSTKYYMIHEKTNGSYTQKDLLGCEKDKDRLFEPFYEMDTNQDFKLTAKELKVSRIRFVSQKLNGKLELEDKTKDFSVDNIDYIDMFTLATYSDKIARPYGTFNMFVRTENGNTRKYIGHVGYVWPRKLERLFR